MTPRRAIHRFATDQRGTAAIEFAFVIGPLMLLMVGLVEVSRFVWVQNAVHEAAISGARCMGIKAASCANANAYSATLTNDYIRRTGRSWGLLLATSDIALNPASGCGQPTGVSSVVITYQFNSVLTLLTGERLKSKACFPNQN